MTGSSPPPEAFSDEASAAIRADFPELGRRLDGAPLVYLDSAATALRPQPVIDAMQEFSEHRVAAVHRGAHQLAAWATEAFEDSRAAIAAFVGAAPSEVAFTSGTTGSVNLLVASLAAASLDAADAADAAARRFALKPGDRIVVTEAEHHSNLLPWQRLARLTGAELAWLPVDAEGRVDVSHLPGAVRERTRIVAFTHASNVSGAVTDVAAVVEAASAVGALTVLDAAQTAPHMPLDLGALGVDFAAFSAHKMVGPNGIGALYGRSELFETLPPGFTGGSMVEIVTMDEATFLPAPARFEAGTGAVTEAIGWGVAAGYLAGVGMGQVAAHERELTARLLDGIGSLEGVRVLGPADADSRTGAVAVDVAGIHPHDVGQFLDAQAVAVRVGHHCAQPIHRALGVNASTRASLALYNTAAEVDRFVELLSQVRGFFGADR